MRDELVANADITQKNSLTFSEKSWLYVAMSAVHH